MADRAQSDTSKPTQSVQVQFSDDLAEYMRTGVDPSGRYAKPATRSDNLGVVIGYLFIILMFLVGLLSGGTGRKLIEELLRLIQSR